MATSGITPTTPSATMGATHNTEKREPVQNLGKDEFLQLLTTEMSNQDPMEPMDNSQFIAQMAQFSALEQMQQLNTAYTTSYANSLIGKNVVGSLDGVGDIMGSVTGTVRLNKIDYLQIGEYKVPVANIKEVYDTGHVSNTLIAESSQLIGKQIKANVPTEQNDILTGETVTRDTEVTGIVQTILVKDFTVYAKLEGTGKEVPVSYITEINAAPTGGDTDTSATDGTVDGDTKIEEEA